MAAESSIPSYGDDARAFADLKVIKCHNSQASPAIIAREVFLFYCPIFLSVFLNSCWKSTTVNDTERKSAIGSARKTAIV